MKLSYKVAAVAAPLAIITFLLSRVIWPDLPGMVSPAAEQLPFFLFLSAMESVSFGLGVAFVVFGWQKLQVAGDRSTLTKLSFASVTWFLVSWWPHDNMHRVNGMDDYWGLLRIEFLFHFTLMVCGGILALYVWRQITRQ